MCSKYGKIRFKTWWRIHEIEKMFISFLKSIIYESIKYEGIQVMIYENNNSCIFEYYEISFLYSTKKKNWLRQLTRPSLLQILIRNSCNTTYCSAKLFINRIHYTQFLPCQLNGFFVVGFFKFLFSNHRLNFSNNKDQYLYIIVAFYGIKS